MAEPLVVTDLLTIPAGELEWKAVRSSGPGGQNVNKVASRVELRFDLARTRALDAGTRARLGALAHGRLDAEGKVLITSQKTRDQSRNLEDARAKLRELVLRALERPRPRRRTRPTAGSRERRLKDKRQRAVRKQGRRMGDD